MATADPPRTRRALLVASDQYVDPALARLRGPVGDVTALAEVLADQRLGDFAVRQLINRPTEDTKREIEGFFEDARPGDLLLLYMSGHGVLSQSRRFYFTTASTELKWLRATAIEDGFVNDVMQHSRARSIVLIVDCCHSGAFARGLTPKSAPTVDVVPRFGGRGRVTLTASTELEYAFEDADAGASVSELGAAAPGSVFTRFLVEGIKTGAADANRDGQISIDELYDFVYAKVREHSPHQTPGKGGEAYGDLIIAATGRNASLQLDLRQALGSPLAGVREATVAELARMRVTANPALRRTIDGALEAMLEDDSRRVRDAASAALGHTVEPADPPASPTGVPVSAPSEARAAPEARETRSLATVLRRRRAPLAGAVAAILVGGVIAFAVSNGGSGGSSGSSTVSLPLSPARGKILGSDLTPLYADTCLGANEACTVVQYALAGRPTVAASDGVITAWSARGKGRVALQVITLTRTHVSATAQSEFVTLTGNTPQSFQTGLPIKRGDFIALLMCPNAQISVSGNDGDVDLRWDHGVLVGQPRPRGEMQPEADEYAFNATIDTRQTTAASATSSSPCPA